MELSSSQFEFFCQLVKKEAGIELGSHKRMMVYRRLVKRVRELNLSGFSEYCYYLNHHRENELPAFINALTTNITSFFREEHHFIYLQEQLLANLFEKQSVVRIWSAGCSTGEEPYSIAISVLEKMPLHCQVKILATDLDSNVLTTAKNGIYSEEQVKNVNKSRRLRWFVQGTAENRGLVKIKPEVSQVVTFKQLNLTSKWNHDTQFDIIFCRNVAIYFSEATRRILFEKFADALTSNGTLFVGHSETLFRISQTFELVGKTIYRKIS